MAYSTGTATSNADLLDKLRAFLLVQGWTIEAWRFQIAQPTWRWLSVSKSGRFFNFIDYFFAGNATHSPVAGNIYTYYATSYNSGVEAFAQAGVNNGSGCSGILGPFVSYHFFEGTGTSGPYVHCVVEVAAGEFRHFGVGVLNKIGTYTGGEFVGGTSWAMSVTNVRTPGSTLHGIPFDDSGSAAGGWPLPGTEVRCLEAASGSRVFSLVSAPAGFRLRVGGIGGYNIGATGPGGGSWLLQAVAGPINAIAASPLIRAFCFAERASGFFSFIGDPPGFRFLDMTYLSPGDEVVFGSETWKVFPITRKGSTPAEIPQSANFGFAYLK
jgi:hypothetical protein